MTVPVELQVWTAAECAAYLKESKDHFLRNTRHKADFPVATAASQDGSHPRWAASKVIEWALR